MRARACRWLALIAILPTLLLSAFGGAQLLVHSHAGHGTHVHAPPAVEGGGFAPAWHAAHHEHDHPATPTNDPDHEHHASGAALPDSVLVSLPDIQPLRGRELACPDPSLSVLASPVLWLTDPLPNQCDYSDERARPAGQAPLDLIALSAADRIVRTSNALLI